MINNSMLLDFDQLDVFIQVLQFYLNWTSSKVICKFSLKKTTFYIIINHYQIEKLLS